MIPDEILKRVTYAKMILWQGFDMLKSPLPISEGLAVAYFQDAVEMLLRAIAEYVNASLKEQANFDSIIQKIEEAPGNRAQLKIPFRIALSQLNKSRVNFKHFGLLPESDDVKKFSKDIELFFYKVIQDFFKLNFEEISIVDIINHYRIKNHLKKSEKSLFEKNFKDSLLNSAKAFCLLLDLIEKNEGYSKIGNSINFHDIGDRRKYEALYKIGNQTDKHQKYFSLLKYGINLSDYVFFVKNTPGIKMFAAGNFYIAEKHISKDDIQSITRACFRFVLNSAIQVQQSPITKVENALINADRKFLVVNNDEILAYPILNNSLEKEVIRTASINEVLLGNLRHRDKSGYIAIIQDGDIAYIREESVRPIENDQE